MTTDFFRFPHIPHLAWLGDGTPRDDKVLSPTDAQALLSNEVVVEEKLDGANLGFSVGSDGALQTQNRGAYLQAPYHGQFARLGSWLALHEAALSGALDEQLIAFGEWCAARHSLDYDQLPDWWLLFDIYDRREQRFWSTQRRNELAQRFGLATVPQQHRGQLSLVQLKQWVFTDDSCYRHGYMEGLVVRQEDKDWLHTRGKLVRPDFTQAIGEHWRGRMIEWNRLAQPMRRAASEWPR